MKFILLILFFNFFTSNGIAALPSTVSKLSDRLDKIRLQKNDLEIGLIRTLNNQKENILYLQTLRKLMILRDEERRLSTQRLKELEKAVVDLENRRLHVRARIEEKRNRVRTLILELSRVIPPESTSSFLDWFEIEKIEAPKRKLLGSLAEMGMSELESLRIDLLDGEQLGIKIKEEKAELNYLLHDMKEQERILELNRKLQEELLKKRHSERLTRLERYQRLKEAEQEVERLIVEFNARREIEKTMTSDRRELLRLPVTGQILSEFGRVLDKESGLYVFKKGIDLAVSPEMPILSAGAGRVAFTGELPGHGKVVIVDHGNHFYSLIGRLGEFKVSGGAAIQSGDVLGMADKNSTPIYFEVRTRNVPVNPLQWVSHSTILTK